MKLNITNTLEYMLSDFYPLTYQIWFYREKWSRHLKIINESIGIVCGRFFIDRLQLESNIQHSKPTRFSACSLSFIYIISSHSKYQNSENAVVSKPKHKLLTLYGKKSNGTIINYSWTISTAWYHVHCTIKSELVLFCKF
jgi:hypothetical protein